MAEKAWGHVQSHRYGTKVSKPNVSPLSDNLYSFLTWFLPWALSEACSGALAGTHAARLSSAPAETLTLDTNTS